jgi:hypothetical protein
MVEERIRCCCCSCRCERIQQLIHRTQKKNETQVITAAIPGEMSEDGDIVVVEVRHLVLSSPQYLYTIKMTIDIKIY